MPGLLEILGKEVETRGPIPFARFMELALYCPNYGYYERGQETIGREGDFITSVSTGELLGQLLAWQAARWLEKITGPAWRIAEAGAHHGQLALDIMNWLSLRRPEVWERASYVIVEPSPRRRAAQQDLLRPWIPTAKISWLTSVEELGSDGFDGIFLSNELLDAMPVHRLGWDRGRQEWFEWGVGLESNALRMVRLAKPSLDLERALAEAGLPQAPELRRVLPDGFTVEVCPGAAGWWRRAARALRRGKLVTLDYGLEAGEFLLPHRADGTLRAYYRHRLAAHPLERPGEQDLTAHVNFTALRRIGAEEGLETEHDESQGAFLTRVARELWDGQDASFGPWTAAHSRQFQTLTHPEHFGAKFRVLVQAKA